MDGGSGSDNKDKEEEDDDKNEEKEKDDEDEESGDDDDGVFDRERFEHRMSKAMGRFLSGQLQFPSSLMAKSCWQFSKGASAPSLRLFVLPRDAHEANFCPACGVPLPWLEVFRMLPENHIPKLVQPPERSQPLLAWTNQPEEEAMPKPSTELKTEEVPLRVSKRMAMYTWQAFSYGGNCRLFLPSPKLLKGLMRPLYVR